jgi:hypothetical protein
MVAVYSSETSVDFYQTTRHHNSKDNHPFYKFVGNMNTYEYNINICGDDLYELVMYQEIK